MSSCGRRGGGRTRGHTKNLNRYNPNAPNYAAVHRPGVRSVLGLFEGFNLIPAISLAVARQRRGQP